DLANPKLIKRSEKRIAGTQVFESAPPQNVTVRINKVERDEPPASLADVFRGQNGDSPDRRYIQTALEAYGPGTPLDETEGDHSADHEAPVSTASGRARILETSNIDGT